MQTATIPNALARPDHRLGLATIIASSCAINLLSLALPFATLQIYDRVLHSHNLGTLQMLAVGVIVAVATETFLRVIRAYLTSYRGAAYAHGAGCAALNGQIDGKYLPSGSKVLSNDLAAFNAIKSIREFVNGQSIVILIDLMFLPLFVFLMARISNTLVLVPFALLCGFAIATAAAGLGVRQRLDLATTANDRRYAFLVDCLSSINLLKSHAAERLAQRRFERLHRDSCSASYALSRSMTQSFVQGSVLSHLMTVSTVAVGAYMAIAGQLTIGALIAVVQLSSRLMMPVQKAVLLWLRYQDFQSARSRAATLFRASGTAPVAPVRVVHNSGHIHISNLSFRFSPEEPRLLDGVQLTVDRGETLVLDGDQGAGKTALLKLIAGVYPPSAGRILVNDADLAALSPQQRARSIGLLLPRARMFRGTIRDNISRFGHTPLKQALEVAGLLGVSDDFARLPRGIDTPVGPGNEEVLTPGLTQMTAIVRALASKPRIILYDNADEGLDRRYYDELLSLLGKVRPSVAMILVTRDLNARELASRHVSLVNGRIVASNVWPMQRLPSGARV